DSAEMYEHWATEYGVAYMILGVLEQTRIVLSDPRAIAHCYAQETWTYVLMPLALVLMEASMGQGLLWSQGEDHRRYYSALFLMPATY
ncbi:uncharacterized protein BJ212DRAFT_1262803, partial [Suillus subaureus]